MMLYKTRVAGLLLLLLVLEQVMLSTGGVPGQPHRSNQTSASASAANPPSAPVWSDQHLVIGFGSIVGIAGMIGLIFVAFRCLRWLCRTRVNPLASEGDGNAPTGVTHNAWVGSNPGAKDGVTNVVLVSPAT
ncbi:uncharacterized protein LOC144916593 [Branchiostoma floridae x Branchiostoma belcheri]